MAAGLGFKTFTTGEVLTAADTNGYLMQGILVFANASARTAAVTSPQEGQYSYLKDTNALEYYDGAAWVGAPVGDITAVTAGTGISGGGSSGDVTITNSMATTITTKGDLVPGTGSGTFARLAVGNNGETLVADSSTSTGLRYTAGNPIPNPVINSCYDIWQRGTTFTIATNTYGPDRWLAFRGGYAAGSTMSRQSVSDSTNLPNIQYCTRIQRDVSNTSTQGINFQYWQETSNSIPYAGKTVTFSFYARAGANYSPASSALSGLLYTGTGTDQNGATVSYTGIVTAITVSATLTTTWQRFTGTATLATNTNEMGFAFTNTPVGTAGAADYYEVTGVQVDIGSVALPIRRNGATIQGELAACQRYYQRKNSTGNGTIFGMGQCQNTTNAYYLIPTPVVFRTAPSFAQSGTVGWTASTGNAGGTIAVFNMSADAVTVGLTGGSGLVAGNASALAGTTSSAYIELSAEL